MNEISKQTTYLKMELPVWFKPTILASESLKPCETFRTFINIYEIIKVTFENL